MALNRGFLLTVLVAAAAAELVGNASAATYNVGNNLGWAVPPNGPAAYAAWASQHVFRVGDVLVFNFISGLHDVAHVTKGAFDGCSSATNPIGSATFGPASFILNSTGPSYYICTFGQHCSLGQKLAVNVSASSPSPAPSSPPTPSPTPTPSSLPSRSPSPSGAPSLGPTHGGSVTPPPAPASDPTPELAPSSRSLSSPPPPSSATIASVGARVMVFALVTFGLVV